MSIAVVTGASGGLGSELCKRLVNAKVRVILVDRSPSADLRATLESIAADAVVEAVPLDLTDQAAIAATGARLVGAYPAIDYLFNNAGVLTDHLQFSRNDRELHFEVNALAPLSLTDALRPALRAAGHAVVVNTTAGISLGEKTLVWDDLVRPATFSKLWGPYTRSKQALNVLTEALARDLGGDGIAVRAADPGPTKTKLTRGAGTPLWMRVFAFALPTPAAASKHLFDTAFDARWTGASGTIVSGGKAKALPAALHDERLQVEFLARARAAIAASRATSATEIR